MPAWATGRKGTLALANELLAKLMGHYWGWLASQELSIPSKVYCPPYTEPNNDLPSRFSSQSHSVFQQSPILVTLHLFHATSFSCQSVAVSPLCFRVSCTLLSIHVDSAAQTCSAQGIPALTHTEASPVHRKNLWVLGLKSMNLWKINFSHVPRILYPEQAFHGNCKKVLQGHKV